MASEQRRTRATARVILVDDLGRVLLFRGGDPSKPEAGTWWFTPGGEIEPGETPTEAARRELFEETGLEISDVGPPIFHRRIEHEFMGELMAQTEEYFAVRCGTFEIETSRWTDVEVASLIEHRWWTPADLRTAGEPFYPKRLLDYVPDPHG